MDFKTSGHVPKLHPSADLQGCHLAHQLRSNQPVFKPVQGKKGLPGVGPGRDYSRSLQDCITQDMLRAPWNVGEQENKTCFSSLIFVLEAGSHVAEADLELLIIPSAGTRRVFPGCFTLLRQGLVQARVAWPYRG